MVRPGQLRERSWPCREQRTRQLGEDAFEDSLVAQVHSAIGARDSDAQLAGGRVHDERIVPRR